MSSRNRRLFRLQKVLDVREIVEKEKMKALAISMQHLEQEKQRVQELQNEVRVLASRMNDVSCANAHRLSGFHDYLQTLSAMLFERRHAVEALRREVVRKRQELLDAAKERKVMQSLKEKSIATWEAEEHKAEQAAVDELAVRIIHSKRD